LGKGERAELERKIRKKRGKEGSTRRGMGRGEKKKGKVAFGGKIRMWREK
jgi:hypothetical protein